MKVELNVRTSRFTSTNELWRWCLRLVNAGRPEICSDWRLRKILPEELCIDADEESFLSSAALVFLELGWEVVTALVPLYVDARLAIFRHLFAKPPIASDINTDAAITYPIPISRNIPSWKQFILMKLQYHLHSFGNTVSAKVRPLSSDSVTLNVLIPWDLSRAFFDLRCKSQSISLFILFEMPYASSRKMASLIRSVYTTSLMKFN